MTASTPSPTAATSASTSTGTPPAAPVTKRLTLLFVRRTNPDTGAKEVLLGMKKRGFGQGKWNGFGGKVEPGETVAAAALRELQEEACLEAAGAELRGRITFTFLTIPDVLVRFHSAGGVGLVDGIEGQTSSTRFAARLPPWVCVAHSPLLTPHAEGARLRGRGPHPRDAAGDGGDGPAVVRGERHPL